jgi:L-seryl-tRNA(Ser) seleniumtransferase
LGQASLRRVINATGVVLHTNLGRAPLIEFEPIAGYSNLEYDLAAGKRGKRDVHTGHLLEKLIGRPGILVNNNAAAVFLVLHEMAAGSEVIVSRGELIEIGDGFRIPEIMARSGALLREVGTTNRTSLADYADAITEKTKLIMRVHPSNFRVTGFTARPALKELAELGRSKGVPVYEDLGSGCLTEGIHEPLVGDSVAAGINLLSFSCDKLLGGPADGHHCRRCGVGDARAEKPHVSRVSRGQIDYSGVGIDVKGAVTAGLASDSGVAHDLYQPDELKRRAERVSAAIGGVVREGESPIGGGSTPDQVLPTWVVELDVPNANAFEKRLRATEPPVVARIEREKIVLDMRTVADTEIDALVKAIAKQ